MDHLFGPARVNHETHAVDRDRGLHVGGEGERGRPRLEGWVEVAGAVEAFEAFGLVEAVMFGVSMNEHWPPAHTHHSSVRGYCRNRSNCLNLPNYPPRRCWWR